MQVRVKPPYRVSTATRSIGPAGAFETLAYALAKAEQWSQQTGKPYIIVEVNPETGRTVRRWEVEPN